MRKSERGTLGRGTLAERPFTAVPRSAFPLPRSGWGGEVLRDHRRQNPRGRGGREPRDSGWGGARDRPRPRIGNAALSPAARWSVVDRSRRAARGCRAVDAGVAGRAGGSRGAGRTQPRDRGGERQEQAVGRRRHGTRADARPGGADRGGGGTAGGCRGRSRGGRGDENGERAAGPAAGDGPNSPRRRRAGGRKRCLARDPREPGTLGLTGPYGPGIVRGCHPAGFFGKGRNEDVQSEKRGRDAPLVRGRCGRPAARPAGEPGGADSAREAQAHVHAAPEQRRLRRGGERRPDQAHGTQARAEALLPAHRLHGPRTLRAAQERARKASRARDREGGVGHAAKDDALASEGEADAESLCRSRAPARGPAARAAQSGGGSMSSAITPELRWHAVGRRKVGVARVYLTPGSGKWNVNGRTLGDYFPRPSLVSHIQQPFTATDTLGAFDVRALCRGGGVTGQAGAMRLAIARALCLADERHRKKLREQGLLTRDPRVVERKKPGRAGARKRFQFSKR